MFEEYVVDPNLDVPIYQQLVDRIRADIKSEKLPFGMRLPTVRALADEMKLAVGTVKRAYDELEKEGFIYTVPAKGCFVAARNIELLREDHLRKIENYMQEILKLSATCGLSRDEVLEMWQLMAEEEDK